QCQGRISRRNRGFGFGGSNNLDEIIGFLPTGIAVDDADYVFVTDQGDYTVKLFRFEDHQLIFLSKFGEKEGDRDGISNKPHGIAVSPDGFIFVAEPIMGRIKVLELRDEVLQFLRYDEFGPVPQEELGLPIGNSQPYDMCWYGDDHLYVSFNGDDPYLLMMSVHENGELRREDILHVYNPTTGEPRFADSIATTGNILYLVEDNDLVTVVIHESAGGFSHEVSNRYQDVDLQTSDILFIKAIAVNQEGHIFLADNENHVIKVIQFQDNQFRQITVSSRILPEESHPVINSMVADNQGHLFISVYGKILVFQLVNGELLPVTELSTSVEYLALDGQGRLFASAWGYIDIFSFNGETLHLSDRFYLPLGNIYNISAGEDGLIFLTLKSNDFGFPPPPSTYKVSAHRYQNGEMTHIDDLDDEEHLHSEGGKKIKFYHHRLYIADGYDSKIKVYEAHDGEGLQFKREFGGRGFSDGLFSGYPIDGFLPYALDVQNDKIYAVDEFRLQVFPFPDDEREENLAIDFASVENPILWRHEENPQIISPQEVVDDQIDNCPGISNVSQVDTDQDGSGDECDKIDNRYEGPDNDGDGLSDAFEEAHGLEMDSPDSDGDGISDGEEIGDDQFHPKDGDNDGFLDAQEKMIVIGSSEGKISGVANTVFDEEGNIFVADLENWRVMKFGSRYEYLDNLFLGAKIIDLKIARQNTLWALTDKGQLVEFDRDLQVLRSYPFWQIVHWRGEPNPDWAYSWDEGCLRSDFGNNIFCFLGLNTDNDGNIFVAYSYDRELRISQLDVDGHWSWQLNIFDPENFNSVIDVVIHPDPLLREIYVLGTIPNFRGKRILVYNRGGEFLRTIGSTEDCEAIDALCNPSHIHLIDRNLFIENEFSNERSIKIYSLEGVFQNEIAFPHDLSEEALPYEAYCYHFQGGDLEGNLYFGSSSYSCGGEAHLLRQYNAEGQLLQLIGDDMSDPDDFLCRDGNCHFDVDSDGNIYVLSLFQDNPELRVFDHEGQFLQSIDLQEQLGGLDIHLFRMDSHGNFYFLVSCWRRGEGRCQIDGEEIWVFNSRFHQIAVIDEENLEFRDEHPDFSLSISSFDLDERDRLYVLYAWGEDDVLVRFSKNAFVEEVHWIFNWGLPQNFRVSRSNKVYSIYSSFSLIHRDNLANLEEFDQENNIHQEGLIDFDISDPSRAPVSIENVRGFNFRWFDITPLLLGSSNSSARRETIYTLSQNGQVRVYLPGQQIADFFFGQLGLDDYDDFFPNDNVAHIRAKNHKIYIFDKYRIRVFQ
ncbi:MAG TPA: hypothetical protein DDW49_00925, partial [Deltaproteobacteria bacterium]|nr:hypothetical protein [Deltaproteobacteria bacterium]